MINLALPNLLKNAFFILKNVLDYKVNKDASIHSNVKAA